MAISKELKGLYRRYVKIYGRVEGKKKALEEYDRRKKMRSERKHGLRRW